MNLANKLTVFRMILVPIMVIVSLFYAQVDANFYGISYILIAMDVIFIIASITDKLDGQIARKRNQVTTFGKFLDPIADKILVLAAMVILVEIGKIPAWIPIIVLIREFMVSGYRLVAAGKGGEVIAASIWGKLKTVSQMFALILAFLDVNNFADCFRGGLTGFSFAYNLVVTVLLIISSFATIFSGLDYMKDWKKYLKD
jgi:CDP-diacylglycerol--glycerol-3-phosphate 3-phosphatidyltransferase